MIYNEKSSFWGYPCFRKPPYILLYVGDYTPGTGNPFLIRMKWNDTWGFSQQCSIDRVICRAGYGYETIPKKDPGCSGKTGPCDAPATPVGVTGAVWDDHPPTPGFGDVVTLLHMPLHVHCFNNTHFLSHYWLNKLKHVRGRKRHWS